MLLISQDSEMDDLLDQFINYLRIERGLAGNTVASYSRDLIKLSQFLAAQNLSPLRVTQGQIEKYIKMLGERLSARSVARNISAMKTFFRFLVSEGRIEGSPARLLETPRTLHRLPGVLSQGEVERLLAQPDAASPRGQRDCAMLEILYATGDLAVFDEKSAVTRHAGNDNLHGIHDAHIPESGYQDALVCGGDHILQR